MDQNPSAPSSHPSAKSLEGILEEYLVHKAPIKLPAGLKEFIVKLAPWISIIGIVLALPVILLFLGISTFFFPLVGYTYQGGWYYVGLLVSAAIILLEAAAIPGLFKRSIKAWRLVFYAVLLQLLNNLLDGGVIGALITGLISLYFLFQVKAYYK